jgi:hypothetical protein
MHRCRAVASISNQVIPVVLGADGRLADRMV